MTTSKLEFSPEARSLFDQAYENARAEHFLWIFETASREDAQQWITDTFFEAAAAHELERGESLGTRRFLDEGEARLALAQLKMIGGGNGPIGASAAEDAYQGLHHALNYWKGLCGRPKNSESVHPTQQLIADTSERAKGWRRISSEFTAKEVRALFHMKASELFDTNPGISAVDSLFVYLMINDHVGGVEVSIPFSDTQWIANRLLAFTPLNT